MKKNLLAAVIAVEILAGSVCSATVSQSQLEIGGVKYGATISAVESKLGKPTEMKSKTKNGVEKVEYKYGGVEIEFIDGKVHEIEVDDYSTFKTVAGIGIGSTVADVERAYGEADIKHYDKYIYYNDDQTAGLVFEIKNGLVHEMKCGNLNQRKNFKEKH